MIRKIVIAPDSFKGCLSAADVAEACLRAIRSVAPGCETVKLPVADGGEGTSRAVTEATGGDFVQCQVCDPLMRPVTATYGISPDGTTAYMDANILKMKIGFASKELFLNRSTSSMS